MIYKRNEQLQKSRAFVLTGLFALIVLLGGFFAWAVLTRISGAIIAPGHIEVDHNRQIIQHQTGGTVADILVEEGDAVKAGDVLLRLDDKQLKSELTIVEGQLFEIMARRARLIAERDGAARIVFDPFLTEIAQKNPDVSELLKGQENLFSAHRESIAQETEQLNKRKIQIINQILGMDTQEKSLKLQLGLIEEESQSQKKLLKRGLAQIGKVLALQRQTANLEGELGKLAVSRAQAEGQAIDIELEVLKLAKNRRAEAIGRLRDLRVNELELREKRAALKGDILKLEIRAPVSGVVYGMRVHTIGSVIRPADPVLYLIPQDQPLLIVARVDPLHIDQVMMGQEVHLRLSAFDTRTTPELIGQVTLISADAFEDDTLGQKYYRAEISLMPGEISRLNGKGTLIPGMPVEAFIHTAEYSPLTYLVKPFEIYFNRALRET